MGCGRCILPANLLVGLHISVVVENSQRNLIASSIAHPTVLGNGRGDDDIASVFWCQIHIRVSMV
jgi:hypothetical protein